MKGVAVLTPPRRDLWYVLTGRYRWLRGGLTYHAPRVAWWRRLRGLL